MDELDAYRAAKLLLDSKGEDAMAYARERIADLTVQGDMAGRSAWLRIAAAMAVLGAEVPVVGQRIQ